MEADRASVFEQLKQIKQLKDFLYSKDYNTKNLDAVGL